MCGIAGLFALSDAGAMRSDVERMIATLEHRGPDDAGIGGGPGWALGMRRLAVQDVSAAGHQPMHRGHLTAVYNGEVYNFPHLRRELEAQGYAFESGSDTEVVVAAFHRWGTEAFARFNGMFALAIVDDRAQRVWLARDRFGKKPLFLARLAGRMLFASELKSIVAVAGRELTLERASLARYFGLQYVPSPYSIFSEVEKVPPASWIEVDLKNHISSPPRKFWHLPTSDGGRTSPEPQELLELVRASVRRRLIADVPLGAFLSGGTDSSLVVACMREEASDVRTFSIGFEDPRFDESGYAIAVAEHLGTRHTHHTLSSADAIGILPRFASAYDEPFADSSAIPTMAVAELARRDVTVALSGDGGDELFGGYLRYRAQRYLRLANALPRRVAKAIPQLAPGTRTGRRVKLFRSLASTPTAGRAYQDLVSVWRWDELTDLMPEAEALTTVTDAFDTASGALVERMMRADAATYLVDDILQKVDRATMAVSLEARNPLLDPDVVSFAFGSARLAAAHPAEKRLLRDALRLRLPDQLVDRPKKGFGVPIGEWLRHELRPLLEDLVMARRDPEYNGRLAHELCRRHLAREIDATPQVWSLLVFELWRERWRGGVAVGM